jgi:hypothetical protein
LGAREARACGGLFCSRPSQPVAPQPVDQNAERIIFVVNGDHTITAHVQIQYAGGSDSFAWVVPVPSTPTVAESSIDFFQQLDQSTSMSVQLPVSKPCAGGGGRSFAVGCASSSGIALAGEKQPAPPVTVYEHSFTQNYAYDVIGAEKTQDLVDWLNLHGYNVSDNMTAAMAPYNTPGMKFLGLKLRDGKTVRDIVPIKMTYVSDDPMIPIQLTRVAAQPLMGILVFIVADTPFLPMNYSAMRPDPTEIFYDQQGQTSYFEWVARKADEADGKLFVIEAITDSPNNEHPIVSRFYTRLSPETMKVDPTFVPADASMRFQPVLDLSQHAPLFQCSSLLSQNLPSPCAFNYCGSGSTCVVETTGGAVCQCKGGDVAQVIAGPDGKQHVTCVPATNPSGVTPEAAGVGTAFDPCATIDCGAGTCVVRGGFATCACASGAMARYQSTPTPLCMMEPAGLETFGPGAGIESKPKAPMTMTRVVPRDSGTASAIAWAGVMILGLVWSKKRYKASTSSSS